MKIQLNTIDSNNQRIPTDSVYNLILTLIIAFAVVWIIYTSTSYSHYSVYLIENNNK
jgi:hypothetical protein